MSSELTKIFGISSETPSGDTLEVLKQHYFIELSMRGSDDATVGGLRVNTGGRKDAATLAKQKEQQATNDLLLIVDLQRQLDIMTSNMIGKYGEDFAEQFAAELLEPDVFAELMKIEDPIERQQAMAQAILDGIANGTIDPADVNPDFIAWLNTVKDLAVQQQARDISLAKSHQQDLALEVADKSADDNLENDVNKALSSLNLA